MYSRDRYRRRPQWGGMGGSVRGPPPRDVVALLAALFVTFTLQFFESTAALPALLRLSPGLWQRGFLWQALTYAFVGRGAPDIWFLLELLIVYWFASDVYAQLGRRRFRRLLAISVVSAAVVASLFQLFLGHVEGLGGPAAFSLMQGQRTLIAVLVAAYATLNAHATIYLFFVLPVQARYFIAIEIVLAFFGFLSTRDGAGFAGLCTAVGVSWATLAPGGTRERLRHWRLKWKRRRVGRELKRLRRERELRIVGKDDDEEEGGGGWVN